MAKRRLKLPDGGTMDLSVPEGFGAPEPVGLGITTSGRTIMYLVGAAFGAVAGFLIVYAAVSINDAIERA
jgi:hypothetical protein